MGITCCECKCRRETEFRCNAESRLDPLLDIRDPAAGEKTTETESGEHLDFAGFLAQVACTVSSSAAVNVNVSEKNVGGSREARRLPL